MLEKSNVCMTLLAAAVALLTTVSPAVAQEPGGIHVWQPRISIVWPHDGQGNPTSAEASRAVNISVWPQNQVGCDENPLARAGGTVREFSLWMAKNNEPTREVEIPGQLSFRGVRGVRFPTVEYNDVPAALIANPQDQYRFTLGLVPGGASGIWVHAADGRTAKPEPVVPIGHAEPAAGGGYDAYIQIVWPHDAQGRLAPVERATLVNIAVDIFSHGTRLSVPPNFEPDGLSLGVYTDDGRVQVGDHPQGLQSEKTTYTVDGQTYPRWVFNDVPVEPGERYHFMALVYHGKIQWPYTTIWTHAADARTILPEPQAPQPCLQ